MNVIRTLSLVQKAYQGFDGVHVMTDEERTRLQKHLLKMYKEIEAVCVKHGLTVMLAYGSVLGAIRHKGFIPWDDDMDLFMPRKDYELLINKYADELPDYLQIYAPNARNKAYGRFAKVIDVRTKFIRAGSEDFNDPSQGIFVDIFPLESMEHRPLKNKVRRFIAMLMMYIGSSVGIYEDKSPNYRRLMRYSVSTRINYWLRYILGMLFSFVSYQKWMNKIDKFCRNDEETGFVADLLGDYTWKPIPLDVFTPPVKGEFDGTDVFLPHDSIDHLVRTYGNWQRIPPEEDRMQHFIREIHFYEGND